MSVKDTAWILNRNLTKEEHDLFSLLQGKDKGKVDNFFEENRKKKGILVEDRSVLNAPIKMSKWLLDECIKEGISLKCDYDECTLVAKEIKKSNLKINFYNIKG